MATTRREFLQAGMVAGSAAAATLPALKALAQPVLTVALVRNAPSELKVRMSCNLHGLWENTIVA